MVLERGKAGDGPTVYAKRRNSVGDHLFRFRDGLKDCATQRLKRAALRLLDSTQVLVNVPGGHRPEV